MTREQATRVHNAAYDICEAVAVDLHFAADAKAEREIIRRIDAEIAALAALRGYRLVLANEARAA